MEFEKERVYSAVNADELKPGDKVIVADDLATLRCCVKDNSPINTLTKIENETHIYRFFIMGETNDIMFILAYLVERKENCTNCERLGKTCNSREDDKITCCFDYKPKTEPKAEKHYRPFRDTDELIEEWDKKLGYRDPTGLAKPYIWVQTKNSYKVKLLITGYDKDNVRYAEGDECDMKGLFEYFEFLDGSPCGVEE